MVLESPYSSCGTFINRLCDLGQLVFPTSMLKRSGHLYVPCGDVCNWDYIESNDQSPF